MIDEIFSLDKKIRKKKDYFKKTPSDNTFYFKFYNSYIGDFDVLFRSE